MTDKDLLAFTQQVLDFGVQLRNFKSILANGLPEEGSMFADALNSKLNKLAADLTDLQPTLDKEARKVESSGIKATT